MFVELFQNHACAAVPATGSGGVGVLEGATGQIVGIDPDFLELIARRTGLKFEHAVRSDWGRVVADFKAGELDLLLNYAGWGDGLRVSVGTDAEIDAFLARMRSL